ncbi:MAG: fluoride efflux transporter CrcB [Acidobacteria bacterium]|nr:fluoride efflux transporter CrcB [Acidobacteriota bacterium]
MTWLLIGIGGGLGAMARHALNGAVHRLAPGSIFPTGIFVVNVLGSAAIGLLAGLLAGARIDLRPDTRTFLIVGVLGGFTTFSSFSLDTFTLLRSGHLGLALWNIAGQVGLSLVALAVGFRIGHG